MKTKSHYLKLTLVLLALATLNHQLSTAFAQGTAFTYQGRLNNGSAAANGSYDLTFTLFNVSSGGSAVAGPLTNSATSVSNGLFLATLDFGGVFNGANYWLEIGVRTNGNGAFITLAPRQQLTATPYAVTAGNVTGSVAAGQIMGTLTGAQLPPSVVTNGASGVNFSGTFTGNGAGMTNVSLAAIDSSGAISATGGFVLTSSPAVGSNPRSVVAADVNGDGRVDLICVNTGNNTLSVLTNNGSGGFVLASSPAVGSNPRSVVAADVNGDGRVDLISANFNDNTLTVLTNNGSGAFALASSPAVGSAPDSVTAADVNGDSRMDLICANYLANTLTVLTNNGSGGFLLASSPTVGNTPYSVVAADVNGDGRVDLICANNGDNTLSVLTNNGSGGFVLASSPALFNIPVSVTAADVNGDGRMDLICANTGGANTLTVLINNGSGNFVLASSPAVGSGPNSVVAADVNGDGRVDLISANTGDNTLSVLTNNGSGAFALASTPAVGSGPNSVVAADVNGDGRMDLISANSGDNTLSVLLNRPSFQGNFQGNFTGRFSGDGAGLTNVALLNRNAQTFTGTNTFNNNVTVAAPGNVFFGSQTRQMLNLWNANYGIGVQNNTEYFRTSHGFAWFLYGVHSDTENDPGGGSILMILNNGGLAVNGTFVSASDRNLKENFKPVSAQAVLDKVAALPISRWNYKQDTSSEHLGPMAQDFYAAFNIGPDDKHIAVVDESGVALAAIQGLNQKLEETRAENAELKARLEKLEQLMNEKNGGVK